jgi:Flp pilus assembly pilin Flp
MVAHSSYARRIALPGERGDALPRLHRCTRGAVSVEYLIVVAVVGLSLSTVLVALGGDAAQTWSYSRRVLYGASP